LKKKAKATTQPRKTQKSHHEKSAKTQTLHLLNNKTNTKNNKEQMKRKK